MRYMVHRFGCIVVFLVSIFLSMYQLVRVVYFVGKMDFFAGFFNALLMCIPVWLGVRFIDEFIILSRKYYRRKSR